MKPSVRGCELSRPLGGLLVLLIGLSLAPPAWSQATTGSIEGVVTDESGAVIPNAEVTLRSLSKGWIRTVRAGADGWYSAPSLEVGAYEVTVAAQGFSTARFEKVELAIGQTRRLDATLNPAPVTEVVTVTEAPPLVETSKTESSSVVSGRQIGDLPINGRRFTDFVLLTPGVSSDSRGLTGFSTGDLSFGGLRGVHNNIQIDGADNNNAFFQQARGRFRAPYQISQDAVAEFRVLNSNYSSEFGRAGGAIVNVITKSGTNDHHGDAFYFIRDSSAAARHSTQREKLRGRQQQFGASIGGPLFFREKLFYFANYDQQIFHIPQTARLFCRTTVPGCQSPNVFTAAELASPLLNSPLAFLGGQTALNFLRTLHTDFTSAHLAEVFLAKVDWRINPNHTFTGRYNLQNFRGSNNAFFDQVNPLTFFAENENGTELVRTDSLVFSLTSLFSSTLLNEFRYQLARDDQKTTTNSPQPLVNVRDITFGVFRSTILPRRTDERRHQFLDNLTWTRGAWTFKTGFDLNRVELVNFFPGTFGGSFAYEGLTTSGAGSAPTACAGVPNNTANQVFRFACNEARTFSQNVGANRSFPDTMEIGFYGQASWRATRRLTWNFGLRYDLQTYDESELVTNVPVLVAGFGNTGEINEDLNNFGPRMGLAYVLTDDNKTVIRGGYGIYYSRTPQIMTSTAELGNAIVQKRFRFDRSVAAQRPCIPQWPNLLDPTALFSGTTAGLPAGCNPTAQTSDIFIFARDFVQPYIQQWSLSVERELPGNLAVAATYLGLRGTRLNRSRDRNLPLPLNRTVTVRNPSGSPLFTTTLACFTATCTGTPVRPLATLGQINTFESAGKSIYNAFILTVNKRWSHGLQFLANYTWSKTIDNGQDALIVTSAGRVQNSFNIEDDRALSVTDQRNRFVLNWIYQPQAGNIQNPGLRYFLDHWRFSSIATVGSGRPVTPSVSGDPNRDGNTSNDRTAGLGRNTFTLPGFKQVDLRITRRIPLTETKRFEFVAEFFNVFNTVNRLIGRNDDGFFVTHSNFSTSAATCGGAAFAPCYTLRTDFPLGSTPGAFAQRQVQFALKFFY